MNSRKEKLTPNKKAKKQPVFNEHGSFAPWSALYARILLGITLAVLWPGLCVSAEEIPLENHSLFCYKNFYLEKQKPQTDLLRGQLRWTPRLKSYRTDSPARMFGGIDLFQLDSCSLKRTRTRTWLRGYGNWGRIGHAGTPLEAQSFGIALGLEQQFGRSFLLGASLVYNNTDLSFSNNIPKEKISATAGSIYARTTFRRCYIDLEGGYGRNAPSYQPDQENQWHFNIETGTWWEQGLGNVEPYIGIKHVNLNGNDQSDSQTNFHLGTRYSWKTVGNFAVTTSRLYAGLVQELGSDTLLHSATQVDSPTIFRVPDYEIPKTRFLCGGGFTSALGNSLDLYLRYTAEIATNYSSHTLLLGMNWNF